MHGDNGVFKDIEVGGGSIGLCLARLWKKEVGGVVLQPGHDTPWDSWLILGISKRMGFAFLRPIDFQGNVRYQEYDPSFSDTIEERERETVIVHQSRLRELLAKTNS